MRLLTLDIAVKINLSYPWKDMRMIKMELIIFVITGQNHHTTHFFLEKRLDFICHIFHEMVMSTLIFNVSLIGNPRKFHNEPTVCRLAP